jgi:hypothetical protein
MDADPRGNGEANSRAGVRNVRPGGHRSTSHQFFLKRQSRTLLRVYRAFPNLFFRAILSRYTFHIRLDVPNKEQIAV